VSAIRGNYTAWEGAWVKAVSMRNGYTVSLRNCQDLRHVLRDGKNGNLLEVVFKPSGTGNDKNFALCSSGIAEGMNCAPVSLSGLSGSQLRPLATCQYLEISLKDKKCFVFVFMRVRRGPPPGGEGWTSMHDRPAVVSVVVRMLNDSTAETWRTRRLAASLLKSRL
jgi:hypothetical protein